MSSVLRVREKIPGVIRVGLTHNAKWCFPDCIPSMEGVFLTVSEFIHWVPEVNLECPLTIFLLRAHFLLIQSIPCNSGISNCLLEQGETSNVGSGICILCWAPSLKNMKNLVYVSKSKRKHHSLKIVANETGLWGLGFGFGFHCFALFPRGRGCSFFGFHYYSTIITTIYHLANMF